MPSSWAISEPETLMVMPLRSMPPSTIPGPYEMEIVTHPHTTDVRLRAADQVIAASGRMAIHGASAIIDQVETNPAHRRRGLGSFVMNELCTRAALRGASRGVLVATLEGVALYRSLGWTIESPITAAVHRPDTARAPSP
ncbi:GNAT family N-acetyltransferase [Pendulispora brunnea]|uniref:GNAT family N-acetyltransferase n=1 Tax=Pendulispora brunnea TaxID=2905690 RepID=A0ABZ2KAP5_9BACT